MISYKKIDLLQISMDDDNNIIHRDKILEIKSPIIEFCVEDSLECICLIINKYSDLHNLFINLLGYIERIYNINKIVVNIIDKEKIKLYIKEDSQFFDEGIKEFNKSFFNSKNTYKGVVSFNIVSGSIYLKQLVLVN